MFCFVGNVAHTAVMGSVPFVAKMESITFWAIRCLTKANMTKAFNNFGERRLGNHVKEMQAVNIWNKKKKSKVQCWGSVCIFAILSPNFLRRPRSQM